MHYTTWWRIPTYQDVLQGGCCYKSSLLHCGHRRVSTKKMQITCLDCGPNQKRQSWQMISLTSNFFRSWQALTVHGSLPILTHFMMSGWDGCGATRSLCLQSWFILDLKRYVVQAALRWPHVLLIESHRSRTGYRRNAHRRGWKTLRHQKHSVKDFEGRILMAYYVQGRAQLYTKVWQLLEDWETYAYHSVATSSNSAPRTFWKVGNQLCEADSTCY